MESSSCWRTLKTRVLPSPSDSSFSAASAQRLGAGILGQDFEVGFDARLRLLEFLFDGFQRVAVVGRQRRRHVRCHQVGAGDHVAEQFDVARRLAGVVGRQVGGAEDRIDLRLRVHHRRRRGGDEIGLRLAQGGILLVMQGGDVEPLARGRAEALDHVVDVLDGLVERRDDVLVGAEFDDLAELLQRQRLGFLHLLGAFVQRLFAARGQQRRPLAGKARALRRKLQAGGEAGDVPSAEVDHGSAETSEHQTGAGADHDRHAGDDGEGDEQTAPDAEPWKAETLELEFAVLNRNAMCPPPRLRYLGMFPRAAVSRYPVNNSGKPRALSAIFSAVNI